MKWHELIEHNNQTKVVYYCDLNGKYRYYETYFPDHVQAALINHGFDAKVSPF